MSNSLLSSFLGALQASLSVLLVISYGVIASQYGWLDKASSKKISTFCVKLCLPFLLITKVGKELSQENVLQYAAILGKCHYQPTLPLLTRGSLGTRLQPIVTSTRHTRHQVLQAALMGDTSRRLQQHHIAPTSPGPISRSNRYPQQAHSFRRRHILRHQSRSIILPSQRRRRQLSHLRHRPPPHRLRTLTRQ
jgi:hypothetical protein